MSSQWESKKERRERRECVHLSVTLTIGFGFLRLQDFPVTLHGHDYLFSEFR